MITVDKYGKYLCEPSTDIIPEYLCLPNGKKQYLSREQKKNIIYGGECPKICPFIQKYSLNGVLYNCPDISQISDINIARESCQVDANCHFIGNSVLNRMGPNYCNARKQDGCITLTESDLALTDKEITDSKHGCDRLGVGCIFNRGNGDGKTSRKGNPMCLRGCEGSKYWKNPDYIWGGGGTKQGPFTGSYYNSDLKLGPKYLEASPSNKEPNGWGGPNKEPFFGNGKLPLELSIPYTESKGKYTPPCNLKAGNSSVFSTQQTGEHLAGPGCKLTSPRPQFGINEWSYTCNCPYLEEGGDLKSDAWKPCAQWELEQDIFSNRDVCEGCHIQNDYTKSLYGHCILGEETSDTESKILGCIEDPNNPEKCRIKRIIQPIDCPAFCSTNINNLTSWRSSTQCADSLINKIWKPNPKYKNVIDLTEKNEGKQSSPYIPGSNFKNQTKPKDTNYLCRNCSQTSIKTVGTGTEYPNRSYCLVGGSESASFLSNPNFGKYLAKTLICPPTCESCSTGFFNEPLNPIYNLKEATNPSSAFINGPIYIPWIGTQAINELKIEKKKFEDREDFKNNFIGNKFVEFFDNVIMKSFK
jgi:hypothetical protein